MWDHTKISILPDPPPPPIESIKSFEIWFWFWFWISSIQISEQVKMWNSAVCTESLMVKYKYPVLTRTCRDSWILPNCPFARTSEWSRYGLDERTFFSSNPNAGRHRIHVCHLKFPILPHFGLIDTGLGDRHG